MSNQNELAYGNLSRFFSSTITESGSNNRGDEDQDLSLHRQPVNNNNNYSPSIKRPRSSIRQLNLTTKCDNDFSYVYSSKMRKLDTDDHLSSIRKLTDSLQRPSSRLSLQSTASSSSTVPPASLKNSKFLFSSGRFSLQPTDQSKSDSNSLIDSLKQNSSSYFYPGRTSFGGSNLRKNIRRLSVTPYSLSSGNVKCIEAKRTNSSRQSNHLSQDLRLGSVTQRILERLEKAATPIQDAKRTTLSTSLVKMSLPKMFDSPSTNVLNHGRCNVDFNHKPIKYVLSKATEKCDATTIVNERLDEIKRTEQELKNNTESTTFVPKKDLTCGKITSRDIKKNRKIEDFASSNVDESDHYKSLANVKPLSLPSVNLQPFGLPKVDETKKDGFNFSSPITIASAKPVVSASLDVNFSSPKNVSNGSAGGTWDEKFKLSSKSWTMEKPDGGCFSKPQPTLKLSTGSLLGFKKKSSSSWSCSTCCVDNEESADKCVACEEPNPKKKSESKPTEAKSTFKFGVQGTNDFKPQVCLNKDTDDKKKESSNTFGVSSTKPENTLSSFIKKDLGKTWSCPTCMVSNDAEEAKCVSCEEPNPSKKSQSSTPASQSGFKFGIIAGTPVSSLSSFIKKADNNNCPTSVVANDVSQYDFSQEPKTTLQPKESTTPAFKFGSFNKTEDSWICFYCKASNQNSVDCCAECKKIKVKAATKDEVHKYIDSQTFQFGFQKPAPVVAKPAVVSVPTATFKFGDKPLETKVESKTPEKEPKMFELEKSEPKRKESELSNSSNLFKLNEVKPASSELKITAASSSAPSITSVSSATVSAPSLFSFGSNASKPTTSTIFKPEPVATVAPETKPTSSAANMFVFGTKPATATTKAEASTEFKSIFSQPKSSESATSSTTTTTVASSVPSIVKFGSVNSTPAAPTSSTPAVPSTFTFGSTTSAPTSAASQSSLFTFGAAAAAPAASAVASSVEKGFNFGSPVSFPKINLGSTAASPINTNINLNFNQPTSTASSGTASTIFSFGSQQPKPLESAPVETKPAAFNFSAAAAAASAKPLFGSNSAGFNFAPAATNAINSSNSLFTFGGKPTDAQQPKQQQQQPSFMANNSAPAAAASGFNFSMPNTATPNMFAPPNLNSTLQPASFGSFMTPQLDQNAFKFNATPAGGSNSFLPKVGGEPNSITIPTADPTGMFQFSADQSNINNPAATLAGRNIRKARRRLQK